MENYLKGELYNLIKKDESIFKFIHESSLDGMCFLNLENIKNAWMNDKFWRTLGYNPTEGLHKSISWQNIVFKDDLLLVLNNLKKHIEDPNYASDQIIRYKHKNGKTVWLQCRGIVIRNNRGKAIRMLYTHHDITAQKEIEEYLKKSEEKFRLLVQSTTDVIWIYNVSKQCFTYISPSIYNLRGYTVEEAMQLKFEQTLTPDSAKKARKLLAVQVQEFQQNPNEKKTYLYEFQQPTKYGGIIWIEASAHYRYNANKEIEAVGISRDITERKNVENQLIDSEIRYRTLYEKSIEPIAIMKNDFFIDCNQAFLDVLKIDSKDKFKNLKPWEISPEFQPDSVLSKEKAKEVLDIAYSEGHNELEWIHLDSEGKPIWFHISLAKVEIKDDNLLFIIYRDITRQKKFEIKLKEAKRKTEESERRFKKLFLFSNTAVLLLDQEGTIIDCNNASHILFRYEKEELINKKPWMLSPEYQPNGALSNDIQIFSEIISKGLIKNYSFNWLHQDSSGKAFYTEVTLSPITLSDKKCVYAYIRDASYEDLLQKSEAELRKANDDKSKFFSVLAHDLKGSIGYNNSIIELLKSNLITLEDKAKLTNCLYENTTKAYLLLEDLIKWGKATMNREVFKPVDINLCDLIKRIEEFFLLQISQKNIKLIINCSRDVKLLADKNMLETIFRNLIGNAIKFTLHGGEIICNCILDKNYLKVQIIDNGVGMPKEKAEQLFALDNIESTKGTNGESGIGLGLQLVKEYVHMHGGQISAESEVEKGTAICFILPLSNYN